MSESIVQHEQTTAAPRARRSRSQLGSSLHLRFGIVAKLTDELFAALAVENPQLRLERTAAGDLEVRAPAGAGSSNRNYKLYKQLAAWDTVVGRDLGVVFDSSLGSILPNSAIRGPDCAWISIQRWNTLSKEQREQFLPFCPDFVAEIRSRSDRVSKLREKMREYISQGARLGWLIDPFTGKVETYRAGKPVEKLEQPATLSGEDVLPGFVLDLKEILAP